MVATDTKRVYVPSAAKEKDVQTCGTVSVLSDTVASTVTTRPHTPHTSHPPPTPPPTDDSITYPSRGVRVVQPTA